MSEYYECPNCGEERGEGYHVSLGIATEEMMHPTQGWCKKCGFRWQLNIDYPIKEQLAKFRLNRGER